MSTLDRAAREALRAQLRESVAAFVHGWECGTLTTPPTRAFLRLSIIACQRLGGLEGEVWQLEEVLAVVVAGREPVH